MGLEERGEKREGELKLRLDPNYPIEIEDDFAEGNGKATMMLAPRIESG